MDPGPILVVLGLCLFPSPDFGKAKDVGGISRWVGMTQQKPRQNREKHKGRKETEQSTYGSFWNPQEKY